MAPTIPQLERMTAEDCNTAVQRYLLTHVPGSSMSATMTARAHLVTALRERKLWPASVRAGR
jgi:hypothetical protein